MIHDEELSVRGVKSGVDIDVRFKYGLPERVSAIAINVKETAILTVARLIKVSELSVMASEPETILSE